jgi:hypothetical protein
VVGVFDVIAERADPGRPGLKAWGSTGHAVGKEPSFAGAIGDGPIDDVFEADRVEVGIFDESSAERGIGFEADDARTAQGGVDRDESDAPMSKSRSSDRSSSRIARVNASSPPNRSTRKASGPEVT